MPGARCRPKGRSRLPRTHVLGQAQNCESKALRASGTEAIHVLLRNKQVRGRPISHWHCLFVTASVLGSRCWHMDLRVLLSCCPILHGEGEVSSDEDFKTDVFCSIHERIESVGLGQLASQLSELNETDFTLKAGDGSPASWAA